MTYEEFIAALMEEWDLTPAYEPMVRSIYNKAVEDCIKKIRITGFLSSHQEGAKKAADMLHLLKK